MSFLSLGTLNGARGEQTQPNGSRDVDYVICKIGGCADLFWTPVSVPAVCCCLFVCLGVAVDDT